MQVKLRDGALVFTKLPESQGCVRTHFTSKKPQPLRAASFSSYGTSNHFPLEFCLGSGLCQHVFEQDLELLFILLDPSLQLFRSSSSIDHLDAALLARNDKETTDTWDPSEKFFFTFMALLLRESRISAGQDWRVVPVNFAS